MSCIRSAHRESWMHSQIDFYRLAGTVAAIYAAHRRHVGISASDSDSDVMHMSTHPLAGSQQTHPTLGNYAGLDHLLLHNHHAGAPGSRYGTGTPRA